MKYFKYLFAFILLAPFVSAHPTGNMGYTGDFLLWSYVCPVGSEGHYGCVMTWSEAQGVKPWVVSEHSASDWMFSFKRRDDIYLLERYFDAPRQKHRIRLLKGRLFNEPAVLWDWFDDTHRLGEGGFVMLSESEILFARYPHLYTLKQGEVPELWENWANEVSRVRLVENNRLLVQSDETIWLTTLTGKIENQWSNIVVPLNDEPPFMGNRVFDASYSDSTLWLAYWGHRRFDRITQSGRSTVIKLEPPFLPHAVASSENRTFFLASSLDPGHDIKPHLWMMEKGELISIWKHDKH